MPFMFCGASLIFSLYNSCKTNNARVLKIMVTHPPSPPKKIKLKEKCVTLIKNPEEISNPTARQILIFISNYRDTCITIVYTELFLLCVIFALLHLQQFYRLESVQHKTGGEYFPINNMAPKSVCPQKTKEYKC